MKYACNGLSRKEPRGSRPEDTEYNRAEHQGGHRAWGQKTELKHKHRKKGSVSERRHQSRVKEIYSGQLVYIQITILDRYRGTLRANRKTQVAIR